MTIFRFHVRNDTFTAVDENGKDCADIAAARRHALSIIATITADDIREGKNTVHLSVHIDNVDGARVADIRSVATVDNDER